MWQMVNGQMVDLPYMAGQPMQAPYMAPQQAAPYNFQAQQPTSFGANNPPKTNTNIIRVYGIEGARNYQLPPNSDMILFDNDQDIAYKVMVDGTGKKDVLMLDLCEHKEEPKPDFKQFATKDDIAKLREELANIQAGKKSSATEE